jgi:hypothetical protein
VVALLIWRGGLNPIEGLGPDGEARCNLKHVENTVDLHQEVAVVAEWLFSVLHRTIHVVASHDDRTHLAGWDAEVRKTDAGALLQEIEDLMELIDEPNLDVIAGEVLA